MNQDIILNIAKELGVKQIQVEKTLSMLENGDTVAFIARYRKDETSNLDESQILFIDKQYKYQLNLEERKLAVINLIEVQGKLDDSLKNEILACTKLSQVEDLYKPYKQKKKTRAAMAIKKGLQPLADLILSLPNKFDIEKETLSYLNDEVKTVLDAIKGAQDIIAEVVSDDAKLRWKFKDIIVDSGSIKTDIKKGAIDERKVYELYYDFTCMIKYIQDHKVMAINRGEKESILSVKLTYDLDNLKDIAHNTFLKGKITEVDNILIEAIDDGLDRLLLASIENEIRSDLTEKAQNSSIEVFSLNLESLLSQAPLTGRCVLGFDPGYVNGCKLAVVDSTGKMLAVDKIFPFRQKTVSSEYNLKLVDLIKKYDVKIIAIGNGTASRESEKLVSELIKEHNLDVSYAIVSEAGASVWSAQKEAIDEFPNLQVEQRSAISIARRLLDPLSELIKIDPKSIGVGQYQHDLAPNKLDERLDESTNLVVNRVGADLNTASVQLLTHIAGLNQGIAKEIVKYRDENGRFTNRNQLLNVKKLGEKAFKQCAGFLRIKDGEEVLDATSIHPESYDLAKDIIKISGIEKLGDPSIKFDDVKINEMYLSKYCDHLDTFKLEDIKESISKPLRDYRDKFLGAQLKSNILELKDLKVGDKLSGTVRNVVDFGAFVDIGLHDDGLVHISCMSLKQFNHPSDIVQVGNIVDVYVKEIDEVKQRVGLSLLTLEDLAKKTADKKMFKSLKHKKVEKQINEEEAMANLLARFAKK